MSADREPGQDAARLKAEYEALIQFLYLAPVGLVQADGAGEVALMNPIAAQLLMPLSRDGGLDNLFTALASVAPELRFLAAGFAQPSGKICDGVHVHLHAGGAGKKTPQILSLTLLKLDAARLMAVIADVTDQVQRECQLRRSDAWLKAVLDGITDVALAGLDLEGRICKWNSSIGRVTGFGEDIAGQPYSRFYPADAMTAAHLLHRLREADDKGWSLDEGWRLRADGSSFWASVLIAPLPERDPQDAAAPAYCLILRDFSDKREALERHRRDSVREHLSAPAAAQAGDSDAI